LADPHEAQEEYGITLTPWEELGGCQAVILAVPHASYLTLGVAELAAIMADDGTLIDIKSVLDRDKLAAAAMSVWRL